MCWKLELCRSCDSFSAIIFFCRLLNNLLRNLFSSTCVFSSHFYVRSKIYKLSHVIRIIDFNKRFRSSLAEIFNFHQWNVVKVSENWMVLEIVYSTWKIPYVRGRRQRKASDIRLALVLSIAFHTEFLIVDVDRCHSYNACALLYMTVCMYIEAFVYNVSGW